MLTLNSSNTHPSSTWVTSHSFSAHQITTSRKLYRKHFFLLHIKVWIFETFCIHDFRLSPRSMYYWRFLGVSAVNGTVIDDDVSRPLVSCIFWSLKNPETFSIILYTCLCVCVCVCMYVRTNILHTYVYIHSFVRLFIHSFNHSFNHIYTTQMTCPTGSRNHIDVWVCISMQHVICNLGNKCHNWTVQVAECLLCNPLHTAQLHHRSCTQFVLLKA